MSQMPSAAHPRTPAVRRVLDTFRRFAHAESAGGLVLLACAAAALGRANSAGRAFADAPTVDLAKLGILAGSLVAGVVGWLSLRQSAAPPTPTD
jgi:Na+/H+ antiporter NhaA